MKNKIFWVILLIVALLNSTTKVSAQKKVNLNTIYFELGGNGLFTSVNYERQLLKNTRVNFHLGIGIYGLQPGYLTIPFGIKYLFKLKKSNSYITLGLGITYSKADVSLYAIVDHVNQNYRNTNYLNYIPNLAYRKITKTNLMYSLSVTPVINHNGFFPFAGFSIGKNF